MRGVIASSAVVTVSGDGMLIERPINPEEIRYYAMYWDKVVIPGNNLVYVEVPDESVLVETGVIDRPRVQLSGDYYGGDLGQAFHTAQLEVAQYLLKEDTSTDWVLHQIGNELNLPAKDMEPRRILRFELINLLPVPHRNTPISEIFEFKQRRADELNTLHEYLEAAYLEILRSPDQEFSKKKAMHSLEESINNLNTVATEKWKNTSKFDFSVQYNLDGGKIAQGFAAGAIIDSFLEAHTIPVASTIICGLISGVKISAGFSSSYVHAGEREKLAYLSSAHKERLI